MKIIALADNVSYENYFRRGLFQVAIDEGVDVFFITFRRNEHRIDLVRNGSLEGSIPLYSAPWMIGKFVLSGSQSDDAVIFNSVGYYWFWNVLYLRLVLPRSVLVFDVFDWLYYDAKHLKLLMMKCVDMIYRKVSDGIVVVTPELRSHYPGAFLLDNATYVSKAVVTKPDKNAVVVMGSLDNRLDFKLLEDVIDQLVEVDFHFHGWILDYHPDLKVHFARFSERPNVYYHGPYENSDLESMLKPYGIGLLPYSTSNRINNFVNPEKIYHYLQAGLEVISTPIPQAKRMEDYVHIAATPCEFVSCLSGLLKNENRKNERASSRNYHWSVRWRQLRPYLEALTAKLLP